MSKTEEKENKILPIKTKKVHEIKFKIKAQDAENLWELISNAQGAKLDKDAGVPFALYELRLTLDELRNEPDKDYDLVQTPGGVIGSPKRQVYMKKHNLSINYFPLEVELEWVIRKSLLKILKLVLKATVATTTAQTFAALVKLCKTLRLSAWFRANFKKVVTVDLGDDDRDLDDELDPEDLAEAGEDEDDEEDDELDPEPEDVPEDLEAAQTSSPTEAPPEVAVTDEDSAAAAD